MLLILLLMVLRTCLVTSQTTKKPFDCGYLKESFLVTYPNRTTRNYIGECCNCESVAYLDGRKLTWRTTSYRSDIVRNLIWHEYCQYSTGNKVTTTLKPITSCEALVLTLNCYWLSKSFYYSPSPGTFPEYKGTCCKTQAVEYLDKVYGDKWQNEIVNNKRGEYVAKLGLLKLCGPVESTFDCSWLVDHLQYSIPPTFKDTWYHGNCCTIDAVVYLDKNIENWREIAIYDERGKVLDTLKELGFWREETTTTLKTTTLPTSTTPIPTTTTALQCGALANTSCCTVAVTECLTKNFGPGWLVAPSYAGYESPLAECGCVITTTTTSTSTVSTTSDNFNCFWLAVPFNATVYENNQPLNASYNGTCCSATAVNTLIENKLSRALKDSLETSLKWTYLSTLLYCTPGACTDPPLWTNCSVSSTSSSSTTSASTTSESSSTLGTTQTKKPSSTFTESSSSESTTSSGTTMSESGSTTTKPTTTTSDDDSTVSGMTTSESSSTESTSTISLSSSGDSSPTSSPVTSSEQSSTPTSTVTPTTVSFVSDLASSIVSTLSTLFSTTTESSTTASSVTSSGSDSTTTSSSSTLASSTSVTPSTSDSSSSSSSTDVTSSTSGSTPTTSGTSTTDSSSTKTETTSTPGPATTGTDGVYFRNTTIQTYPNCTRITEEFVMFVNGTALKNVTSDMMNDCTTSSPMSTPTTPEATTTYDWPTGGTTRILPSGEIVISESLLSYKNCTTVLMQLIFNRSTNTTKTNIETDPEGCKTSTLSSTSSTTPMTTPTTPSSTAVTTTYNWPTGGTTRKLPSGEIVLSESLLAYSNCTTVLMQLIYNPSTNLTRTNTTVDPEGCKATSSTSSSTSSSSSSSSSPSSSSSIFSSSSSTSNPSTTPISSTTASSSTPSPSPGTTASSTAKTTTFNWPSSGTTKILPSGEILLSESLLAYKNCTTVLMQLIYNKATNETRTETTTDVNGCKATSPITSSKTTTPSTTSTAATTTFYWPTGGTTRKLPSGEIILSESLLAYKNCTTVLMQLIYNPSTNKTRTETTTDAQGCKATSPTTPAPTAETTTFNWPSSGTTKILPSGEILLSESLLAYKNCTTVLMQLIYNKATNTTRTETTTDAQGCKATTTTPASPATTTTFNWPTGGTTKILPSGEIILSESLIAYKNCTTVLKQLIFTPATNTTRTETISDAQGCKATSTTSSSSTQTTTYAWPTGGTTRLLPSGEIILSESLIAYKNCTTVLLQLLYNPTTNSTRTETTTDAQGCKATSTSGSPTTTPMPAQSSTTPDFETTTTFNWPTGMTTKVLPSGEIIISESLIGYKNCTTVLLQLVYNPKTNTTRTETTTDAQGCKATSSSLSPTPTSPMTTPTPTTEPPFTFPESKTTQILPSGDIIMSESLIAYPNCTTVLRQLIYSPKTNSTRTDTYSDAQGCKATTSTKTPTTTPAPFSSTTPPPSSTSPPTYCPALSLDMSNTLRPTFNEVKGTYAIGERVVHMCKKRYAFEIAQQPLKIYQCLPSGKWAGTPERCVLTRKTEL